MVDYCPASSKFVRKNDIGYYFERQTTANFAQTKSKCKQIKSGAFPLIFKHPAELTALFDWVTAQGIL